jgi:hypothetical protein
MKNGVFWDVTWRNIPEDTILEIAHVYKFNIDWNIVTKVTK